MGEGELEAIKGVSYGLIFIYLDLDRILCLKEVIHGLFYFYFFSAS